jgi:hypothetical protein
MVLNTVGKHCGSKNSPSRSLYSINSPTSSNRHSRTTIPRSRHWRSNICGGAQTERRRMTWALRVKCTTHYRAIRQLYYQSNNKSCVRRLTYGRKSAPTDKTPPVNGCEKCPDPAKMLVSGGCVGRPWRTSALPPLSADFSDDLLCAGPRIERSRTVWPAY